jgi:hypothetical protein
MALKRSGKHSRKSIFESKAALRSKLSKLSFAEKLEILDRLRDRALLIASARKKK